MKILSGKELRPLLKNQIEQELKDTKVSFYLYSDRNDFPSQAYLRGIKKTLDGFGIPYEEGFIDQEKSREENLMEFRESIKDHSVLMARPLHVSYEEDFLSLIPSSQDPDMLTTYNRGKLFGGNLMYLTATSRSVKVILEQYHIQTKGKKAVVIGRSTEVGYPCFQLLNRMNAATTLLHSGVDKMTMEEYVKEADIIIFATGKSNLIDRNCFNSNQTVIDCGFNPNGGDLGFIPEEDELLAYTPVPGGVGCLTSYCLLLNAIHLKK